MFYCNVRSVFTFKKYSIRGNKTVFNLVPAGSLGLSSLKNYQWQNSFFTMFIYLQASLYLMPPAVGLSTDFQIVYVYFSSSANRLIYKTPDSNVKIKHCTYNNNRQIMMRYEEPCNQSFVIFRRSLL